MVPGAETTMSNENAFDCAIEWPIIKKSSTAQNTTNPIRNVVDRLKIPPNPHKEVISLGLGDPTVFGNLQKPREVIEAVREVLEGENFDGYPPATGLDIAKEAIAKRYSRPEAPLSANDVIIASGCSGALEIAISAIAHSGQALLLPQPGFSLYRTLCDNKGIQVHYYHLDPNANWEINLDEVESLIKENGNITGWIINNPSNPCGSVYSKEHLQACKRLAAKYCLTIIADEIYEDLVFSPNVYHPMATLAPPIPILTCSGLAKRFLVPGWRVGWILIHDPTPNKAMSAIRGALIDLAGLILGANSIMQASLPLIFDRVPQSFHQKINDYVANNAALLYEHLQGIAGLQVIKPQGAFYMMLGISMEQFDLADDVEVCQKLISEESLICLPGSIFGMENFIRLVFCAPPEMIVEATERLGLFFDRHRRSK